jgi:hypothetical protein
MFEHALNSPSQNTVIPANAGTQKQLIKQAFNVAKKHHACLNTTIHLTNSMASTSGSCYALGRQLKNKSRGSLLYPSTRRYESGCIGSFTNPSACNLLNRNPHSLNPIKPRDPGARRNPIIADATPPARAVYPYMNLAFSKRSFRSSNCKRIAFKLLLFFS